MRFTVSSSALSSKLNMLVKVIGSKNSLPILENFLFQIGNGELNITASDSRLVSTTCPTSAKMSDIKTLLSTLGFAQSGRFIRKKRLTRRRKRHIISL